MSRTILFFFIRTGCSWRVSVCRTLRASVGKYINIVFPTSSIQHSSTCRSSLAGNPISIKRFFGIGCNKHFLFWRSMPPRLPTDLRYRHRSRPLHISRADGIHRRKIDVFATIAAAVVIDARDMHIAAEIEIIEKGRTRLDKITPYILKQRGYYIPLPDNSKKKGYCTKRQQYLS